MSDDLDEDHASGSAHHQPLDVARAALEVVEQRQELLARLAAAPRRQVLAGALDGAVEAVAVEGLEQVVHGVDFEGAQRVLVVGGDEHHRREIADPQLLDHAEAVQLRHLHVQEHQVRLQLAHRLHALSPVGALADQLDSRLRFHQLAEAQPRQRLVVNDQRADAHAQTSSGLLIQWIRLVSQKVLCKRGAAPESRKTDAGIAARGIRTVWPGMKLPLCAVGLGRAGRSIRQSKGMRLLSPVIDARGSGTNRLDSSPNRFVRGTNGGRPVRRGARGLQASASRGRWPRSPAARDLGS